MTKLHKSAVSKISLIQPKKFRTWETGLFKMLRLEMPHFQMAVKVTVASGLCLPLSPDPFSHLWIRAEQRKTKKR